MLTLYSRCPDLITGIMKTKLKIPHEHESNMKIPFLLEQFLPHQRGDPFGLKCGVCWIGMDWYRPGFRDSGLWEERWWIWTSTDTGNRTETDVDYCIRDPYLSAECPISVQRPKPWSSVDLFSHPNPSSLFHLCFCFFLNNIYFKITFFLFFYIFKIDIKKREGKTYRVEEWGK